MPRVKAHRLPFMHVLFHNASCAFGHLIQVDVSVRITCNVFSKVPPVEMRTRCQPCDARPNFLTTIPHPRLPHVIENTSKIALALDWRRTCHFLTRPRRKSCKPLRPTTESNRYLKYGLSHNKAASWRMFYRIP